MLRRWYATISFRDLCLLYRGFFPYTIERSSGNHPPPRPLFRPLRIPILCQSPQLGKWSRTIACTSRTLCKQGVVIAFLSSRERWLGDRSFISHYPNPIIRTYIQCWSETGRSCFLPKIDVCIVTNMMHWHDGQCFFSESPQIAWGANHSAPTAGY